MLATNHQPLATNHSASTREEEFLRVNKPEDLKICDPACGSGHMLTYAFDLLYAIYEEQGYNASEIPEKILTLNLHGIEIDERAGELAAFALCMKGRQKYRRFFRKPVAPKVCVLRNISFDDGELVVIGQWSVASGASREDILHDLNLFEEADNFGSLLRPRLSSSQSEALLSFLTSHQPLATSHSLFEQATLNKVNVALEQAAYLSPKYHVVIANPPYMGSGGMNKRLASWAKDNYPSSKQDLFSMFIERNLELSKKHGSISMITMQSWMFLSRYESLRVRIISDATVISMAHLGSRGFDAIGGEVVQTTAFTFEKGAKPYRSGVYLRLVEGHSEREKSQAAIEAIHSSNSPILYRMKCSDFSKIPGHPFAYWVSNRAVKTFDYKRVGDYFVTREGMATADNDRFLRNWSEISINRILFGIKSQEEAVQKRGKWFPYNKGGEFRKWYGNNELIVEYENDGYNIKNNSDPSTGRVRSHNYNGEYAFREGLTWSAIGSGSFCIRFSPYGFLFDSKGAKGFTAHTNELLSFLNSKVATAYLEIFSPTLDYKVGDVILIPFELVFANPIAEKNTKRLISIAQNGWDSIENSWDFTNLPLLNPDYRQPTLKATYQKLRVYWREMTLEMQRLEEENNRIFIDAYGLQDELTPDVPLKEITLTCNPYYRYGKEAEEEVASGQGLVASGEENLTHRFPENADLEERLLADTMREFISYAVGCMFGRYSLDMPGLVLANQAETLADYLRKVAEYRATLATSHWPLATSHWPLATSHWPLPTSPWPLPTSHWPLPTSHLSFTPDEDNVIPVLDDDYFVDDVVGRFKTFLRVTFGEDHYDENLAFIENALGKGIRKYFLKDFYDHHVRMYKKRPIYWLFSSPKKSFNVLIYMHRYRSDTVSRILNEYLREFVEKLKARRAHQAEIRISESARASDRTKATKEMGRIDKILEELDDYERNILHPLAAEKIEIDLDDGVKVNYNKFGQALRKVTGLSGK